MVNHTTLNQVKHICQTYSIRPQKQKGQNFLINADVIKKIITAADLSQDDVVLEVGPGLGILTEELIKQAKQVVSVELDRKLFNFLKVKFTEVKNLKLINADILSLPSTFYRLHPTAYKIAANLPYNITSRFLKKFLTAENRPKEMTLLIQKEVAQRICAKPGRMSLLAVSVQLYGQPKIIEIVSRNNFWPKPEVDSAILKIFSIRTSDQVDNYLTGISEKKFWQIARIGFSSKRKQLQNNLSNGLKISSTEAKNSLKKANFDLKIRAQSLSVQDWIELAKNLDFYLN